MSKRQPPIRRPVKCRLVEVVFKEHGTLTTLASTSPGWPLTGSAGNRVFVGVPLDSGPFTLLPNWGTSGPVKEITFRPAWRLDGRPLQSFLDGLDRPYNSHIGFTDPPCVLFLAEPTTELCVEFAAACADALIV